MGASGSEIRAGRATVELGVDDKMAAGLKRAAARLKAFSAAVSQICKSAMMTSAAMLAPVVGGVREFMSTGDALDKMSLRTGISVEALSELGHAAKLSGTDLEGLERGVKGMQKNVEAAGQGTKAAVDGLRALGLSARDLQGLSPEQQFKKIADGLARIEDPGRRAAIAMQVLGKTGAELLPMMQGGAAGIEALQKRFRDLGLTISREDATAAAELDDLFTDLGAVFKQAAFVVGAALAPALSAAAKSMMSFVGGAIGWLKVHRELIVGWTKLALGVGAAGIALLTISKTVGLVSTVLGGLAVAVKAVGAATAFLIANPWALLIAAVGVAVAGILYAVGAFGKLRDVIVSNITALGSFSAEAAKSCEEVRAEYQALGEKAKRLAELRTKQRLTNVELSEATGLATELAAAYPELADAIDQVGKKAGSTTALLRGMRTAMTERTKGALADQLKKERDRLSALYESGAGALAAKERTKKFPKTFREWVPEAGPRWRHTPEMMQEEFQNLQRQAATLPAVQQQISATSATINRLDAALKALSQHTGPSIWQRAVGDVTDALAQAQSAYREFIEKNAGLVMDLRVVRAGGIEDPKARELELVRLRYEKEVEAARKAGQDIKLVEAAREEELAQIRKKYQDERVKSEQDLQQELAELRIRATKTGWQEELALLKLQEQQELEAAGKSGVDPAKVGEKFDLLRGMSIKQAMSNIKPPELAVRGTFNAAAMQSLQGGDAAERVADSAEELVTLQKEANKLFETFSITYD